MYANMQLHVSIRHRCPFGAIMKDDLIAISSSAMPSSVETRAPGKVLKKSVVPNRNSMRARCSPKQTRGVSRQSINISDLLRDPPPNGIEISFISFVGFAHLPGLKLKELAD